MSELHRLDTQRQSQSKVEVYVVGLQTIDFLTKLKLIFFGNYRSNVWKQQLAKTEDSYIVIFHRRVSRILFTGGLSGPGGVCAWNGGVSAP